MGSMITDEGRKLRPGGFRAVCQKGHELETFTDRDAFEAHMKGTHKQTMPAGTTLSRFKAYPWKAPKAPEGTAGLAAVLVAAGSDVVDVSGVDGFITEGTFRYDNGTTPPLEALPATVRPIVTGAIARGEMWLVHLDGSRARVEVGRKYADGTAEAGRVEIRDGKVRRCHAIGADRNGWRDAKITEVKRLFPAA